jgi:hypothetical protein
MGVQKVKGKRPGLAAPVRRPNHGFTIKRPQRPRQSGDGTGGPSIGCMEAGGGMKNFQRMSTATTRAGTGQEFGTSPVIVRNKARFYSPPWSPADPCRELKA